MATSGFTMPISAYPKKRALALPYGAPFRSGHKIAVGYIDTTHVDVLSMTISAYLFGKHRWCG
jgi:hypothetical protein